MEKYYIKIENKGEIDISGLHLMGVSSKRNEDKIGFFGSGNKYAIALLLRQKIPFWIYSGTKQVKIKTEPIMFRKQMFEQILINGEKTSLTTSMGVDWEDWFAIRELYCNALDEGDAKIDVIKHKNPIKDKTTIFIELNENLKEFFKNINSYILVNKNNRIYKVKTNYGDISIYSSDKKQFICYRKGIRIYPKNKEKALYRYDFEKIQINESRTYMHEHEIKERIASFFAKTNSREIILNYLRNYKDYYEKNLLWKEMYVREKLSDEWQKLLYGKRIFPESLATLSGDFESKFNSYIVPDDLAEKIAKELTGVEVIGQNKKKVFLEVNPTEDEQRKVDTALLELKNIDFNIFSRIKIVKPHLNDVVAWYEKDDDTIYLAQQHLTTIPYIKNTLLEEHFHTKGHEDGQREFVSFLIDELIRAKEIKP